jgi:hypothetical protein
MANRFDVPLLDKRCQPALQRSIRYAEVVAFLDGLKGNPPLAGSSDERFKFM